MEILTVKNLNFTYPLCEKKSLQNITFSIEKGDFTAICGATGSGKSTLLRMMKRELTPLGDLTGEVCYCGKPLETLDKFTSACKIGFVMQRPEQQIVTDKVWHELAFGLENMNIPSDTIRRRVAEMSSYFGIESWFDKSVFDLSGGQKQLLNLASVMVMQPDILILDEPTSQLDPIAASEFIATLQKLNQELSLTIIIVEHRLEEIVPICDKIIVLEKGNLLKCGEKRLVVEDLRSHKELLKAMPAAVRLFNRFNISYPCPLTVREGRAFIENCFKNDIRSEKREDIKEKKAPALEFSDVCFRYEKNSPDILKNLDLVVNTGEVMCILGGNGSGKTTALGAAAGINKIYSGSIKIFGKKLKEYKNQALYKNCLALLPQDVQTVFLKNTVREELDDVKADASLLPYDLSALMDKHPYDLSGGEQQLVALAKVLATNPRLLLLDEPTKGLDAHAKEGIVNIIKTLRDRNVTIIVVTHDVEFAADCSDRCAMFFRGAVTSCDEPRTFFSENNFYTTVANRMTRGFYDGIVTVDDAEKIIRANIEKGENRI